MKRALLIAGAGTLGGSTYPELVRLGWHVDVVSLEDFASVTPRLGFYTARADLSWIKAFFAEHGRYDAVVDFVHVKDLTPDLVELKPRMDLVRANTDQYVFLSGTASYSRVLIVGNEAAKIEGVKISRGNTGDTWSTAGGAIIYAGTVSNCWFHANQSYYSPAFGLFGGEVRDSLVTGYKEGGGSSSAAACEVVGGTMAGCTVTAGTGASVSGSTVGGTVYVHGANAVVTNCLIYGNDMGCYENPSDGLMLIVR